MRRLHLYAARVMRRVAPVVGLLVLASCQQAATQYDAAEDVRAFVVAVRENDQATFERHIDRPALRAQVLEQIRAAVGDSPLAGAVAEGAVDQLIRPESFKLALERAGAPARTPTVAEIATQLRVVEGGRVCLPRSPEGPCAITFAQSGAQAGAQAGEVWRLVAIDSGDVSVGGL